MPALQRVTIMVMQQITVVPLRSKELNSVSLTKGCDQ